MQGAESFAFCDWFLSPLPLTAHLCWVAAGLMRALHTSLSLHTSRANRIYCTIKREEGCTVKVVVVRSPRLLAGFLRMVFGIKKDSRSEEG